MINWSKLPLVRESRSERAATIVEYTLTIMLMGVLVIASLLILGNDIGEFLKSVSEKVNV